MRSRMAWRIGLMIGTIIGPPALSFAGIKADDVNVGVDASGKLGVITSGEVVALNVVALDPIFGFGLDEPGIITIESEQPDYGLSPLEAGAHLSLEVISIDPALKFWSPGFGMVFDGPGDLWDLGNVPVHEHPFWHIDSTDPGFVAPPGQLIWNTTVRFLDSGTTAYSPSDPFTLSFTTPEPGSALLVLIGGVGAVWRRRPRV